MKYGMKSETIGTILKAYWRIDSYLCIVNQKSNTKTIQHENFNH